MRTLVAKELLPYYDEYKKLLQEIDEDQEMIGQNEDFIRDQIEAGVDPADDPMISLFTDSISDANDAINANSARLDEIDKFLIENNMVGLIYQSRLAVVKQIAKFEKKLQFWQKLDAQIAEKVAAYVKKEGVSEDIASIVLKVGDKKFRAACVALNEREDYDCATETRRVLENMELGTTKMLIPENMLPAKVDGKGIK